jgi:splicing suppressor protein 51
MTILACLEDTLPDLQSRSELTIHLVGASSREVADIVLFEELLHLLPELRHISIVLAGPEAPGEEGDGNAGSELVEMECCAACTTQGRRRTCRLFRGVYDAFGRSEVYQKPDLAVLFHSGRSQKEVESWRPTTRFLVDNAILTLCTTYTEREAVEEVAELDQWGVNVVVRPEVNKWRALVPIPKWWEGMEHDVFFVNYWRYVFRGRALVR